MDYCCDECKFLFRRVGEVTACPCCDSARFRPATRTERDELDALLKTKAAPGAAL